MATNDKELTAANLTEMARNYAKEFCRQSSLDAMESGEAIHPMDVKRYIYRACLQVLKDIYFSNRTADVPAELCEGTTEEPAPVEKPHDVPYGDISLEMYNKMLTDNYVKMEKRVAELTNENKTLRENIKRMKERNKEISEGKYKTFKERFFKDLKKDADNAYEKELKRLRAERDSLIARLNNVGDGE